MGMSRRLRWQQHALLHSTALASLLGNQAMGEKKEDGGSSVIFNVAYLAHLGLRRRGRSEHGRWQDLRRGGAQASQLKERAVDIGLALDGKQAFFNKTSRPKTRLKYMYCAKP
jgi:hypothetical protein